MAVIFISKYVVNVENVIAVLIIETVVLDALARFGKNSPRVP